MPGDTKANTTRRKASTETKPAKATKITTESKKPSKRAVSDKSATKTASVKTAAVKTVAAKAVSKKGKVSTPAAEKPAPKKKSALPRSKGVGQVITADARLRHIEVAAYYIAEKSGFNRDPADCWATAEGEIDNLLLAGELPA